MAHRNRQVGKVSRSYAQQNVSKILIGNKCDLQSNRVVTAEDAKLLAKDYGMEYLETSAAEDFNIDNAFRMMAKMVLERKSHGEKGQIGDSIANGTSPNQRGKKCC